jgi:8-oxo-dGTP pyrophosphatase MutT (NUDIX family)
MMPSPPAATDAEAVLAGTLPLRVAGAPRGHLVPAVAQALAGFGQWFETTADGVALRDADLSPESRSQLLQQAAVALRGLGLVPGWRDELCELRDGERELARFERGAFRTLGLCNRAVHVNGELPDGRLWIARRSARKASSPNKLDNLAAGAISAGETPALCAVRELWEEAGVPGDIAVLTAFPGIALRSLRRLRHGIHDEIILCADLPLPPDFVPRCQDGEVQDFYCMTPEAVIGALADGEFSVEAGLVTADWLRRNGHVPG